MCGSLVPAGFTFCSRCGASVESPRVDGDPVLARLAALFGRELEFVRLLGQGAMGAVYLALDPALQRHVAVKTLLPETEHEPDAVIRLIREARTAAALSHPHVVSVYSVRSNEHVTAIVMQYIEGRALDAALRTTPALGLPVIGQIVQQVASALRHAHDHGVVHRDVKPANVLLEHTGRTVVSDFGLARHAKATVLTETGMIPGTIAYMSPEQCTGSAATPASDQYALGVMAFELLAGRRPFGGSLGDVARGHVNVPPPMSALRADTPRAISEAVARMLSKTPADRYSDLRDVETLFGQLVTETRNTTAVIASISRASTPVVALPTVTRVTQPSATSVRTGAARTRRPFAGIAIAAGLVAIVATGLVLRDRTASPVTTPPTGELPATPAREVANSPPPATSSRPAAEPRTAAPTSPAPTERPSAPSPEVVARIGSDTAPSIPRRDTSLTTPPVTTPPATPPAGASLRTETAPPPVQPPPARTASVADARAIATDFARLLNMRIARDVARLGTIRGDTTLRAELLRLMRDSDFATGFERMASSPEVTGDMFVTECTLSLQWKGGQRTLVAELQADYRDGAWQLTAFRLAPGTIPAHNPE
jgi:serine/threonine protein kinase